MKCFRGLNVARRRGSSHGRPTAWRATRSTEVGSSTYWTVALFATSDANHTTHMNDYIAGANAMLAKHKMQLEIYQTNPAGGARVLPYTGAVFDGPGDPGTVRQQCHNAVPNGRGIPVIFCKRNTDTASSGGIELGSMIPTSMPSSFG